jgi:hypothetical protein
MLAASKCFAHPGKTHPGSSAAAPPVMMAICPTAAGSWLCLALHLTQLSTALISDDHDIEPPPAVKDVWMNMLSLSPFAGHFWPH